MFRISAFFLAIILCGCAPKPTAVGIAFSSRPDVLNSVGIRDEWNRKLNAEGSYILKVSIKKGFSADQSEPFFYLYADTSDGKFALAQLLEMRGKYFYLDPKAPEIFCCPCEGFKPQREDGKWVCIEPEGGFCEPETLPKAIGNQKLTSQNGS